MSKKKTATMTLRDFHGGNIPSELPLPSAPGVVLERKNHDRPASGGWMSSSLHRAYSGDRVSFSRQVSGNLTRSYEEKMSYLPNPANIGRNYDEDERKPVDGHSSRGQSSDLFEEPMYEQRQVTHERLSERHITSDNRGASRERYPQEESSPAPMSSAVSQMDSLSRHVATHQDSWSQPLASQDNMGQYSPPVRSHSPYHMQEVGQPWRQSSLGQQPAPPGTVMGSGTGVQNVWTARKDVEYGQSYPAEYILNDAVTVHTSGSRVAQASALEKVSSGRWSSRMLQSAYEPQVYASGYGPDEGGVAHPSHDSSRFSADHDQVVYADRSAYVEPIQGIDFVSLRESRLNPVKDNIQDSRREQFPDGKGISHLEPNMYIDETHAYGEIGQKMITAQGDAARYVGSRDFVPSGSGQLRPTNNRFNTSESVPHSERRSTVQGNSGWVGPEHLSWREYGEERPIDAKTGLSSAFEKRGFSGRDGVADRDCAILLRSHAAEIAKEHTLNVDSSYHGSGKDDLGYLNSPHPRSRDGFFQEVSDFNRSGRFDDQSQGLDIDQSYTQHLLSPGNIGNSSHDSIGASINFPVDEGKGFPVERTKLQLLPRTKPLQVDPVEDVVPELLQEDFEIASHTHAEVDLGSGSGISAQLANAGGEEPVRTAGRPKLTLKPRSQPVDAALGDSGSVKERMSLFGGARPRELVLKERGVDESVIVGADLTSSSSPSPMSGVRTPLEGNRTTSGGVGYVIEKPEKLDERSRRIDHHETRIRKQESGRIDRLDSRGRREHTDVEKKDERRVAEHRHHPEKHESEKLDVDKQESWRRPVDVPPSPVPGGEVSTGGAGRTIQSAAELAQAFSRSTSFGSGPSASTQGYASQRSPGLRMPGLISGMGSETPGFRTTDVPFSRLTETVSLGPQEFHVSGVQAGYRRTSAF